MRIGFAGEGRAIDKKNIRDSFSIKWALIFLSLLLVVLLFLYYNFQPRQQEEGRVVIFILDRMSATEDPVSHGELVRKVLQEQLVETEIIEIDIDGEGGRIEEDYYLNGLLRILNYRRHHPEKKILVNISLAFQQGEPQQKYIEELAGEDVLLVAAAGNENREQLPYPARFSEVLAVAAARDGEKAKESNYGQAIDLTAAGDIEYIDRVFFPGENLSRRYRFAGTSFAAPRVTGLLADILQHRPDMETDEAINIVKETAQSLQDDLYEQGKLGAGMIDPSAARQRVDKSYRWFFLLRMTIWTVIALIFLLLLWPRFGFYSLFVLIMLVLVVLPMAYLITGFFRLQVPVLAAMIISYLLIYKVSGFSNGLIICIWLGLAVFLNYYQQPVLLKLIFIPGTVIIIIGIEYIIHYLLQWVNNYRLLLAGLGSASKKIRNAARGRLESLLAGEEERLLSFFINSGNRQQQEELLGVILSGAQPPVKELLEYACYHYSLREEIVTGVTAAVAEHRLLPIIRDFLQRNQAGAVEVSRDILSRMEAKVVIPVIAGMLKRRDEFNTRALLEVAASFSAGEAQELISDVISILESSRGMWIRYQAVRTLDRLLDNEERLTMILSDYLNDGDQLVAMEVREVLKRRGNKYVDDNYRNYSGQRN